VNFAAALEVAKNMLRGASPVVLEMGPHPVLFQAAKAGTIKEYPSSII